MLIDGTEKDGFGHDMSRCFWYITVNAKYETIDHTYSLTQWSDVLNFSTRTNEFFDRKPLTWISCVMAQRKKYDYRVRFKQQKVIQQQVENILAAVIPANHGRASVVMINAIVADWKSQKKLNVC